MTQNASGLAETVRFVTGLAPITPSTSTPDYVSLKNYGGVTVIISVDNATTVTGSAITLKQATAVAGTGATAMVAVQPIWKNADVSSTDTLVKSSDAVSIAATAGTTNQELIMEVLPERLAAGYDCIAATLSDSSQATNFVTVTYRIETKYPQATPPAAITD